MSRAFTPLAALLCVGLALAWLASSRPARHGAFTPYSTHDVSASGLSLARAYLRERGRDVSELALPFRLAVPPTGATLLRIRPMPSLVERLLDAEQAQRERHAPEGEAPAPASDGGGDGGGEAAGSDVEAAGSDAEGAEGAEGAEQAEHDTAELRRALGLDESWLAPDERAWVEGGGRLVLAIDRSMRGIVVDELPASAKAVKSHPRWPGASQLAPPVPRALGGEAVARGHALFLADDRPLALALPMGAGEVVLLACPEVLRNDALAAGDHLALLEGLAGSGAVVFDERAHGVAGEPRLLALVASWGLGPAALLLALTLGVAAWRAGVRLGRPDAEAPERRSVAIDLVGSLAALYRAALSRRSALELHARSLRREVALAERLSGERLDARMAALLPEAPGSAPAARSDISQSAFERGLLAINTAFERLHREQRR